MQRLTYLIYTKYDYSYKDNYSKKNRYFYLNKSLEDKFKFERIIFQKQNNGKLGIVIHTRNIDLIDEYLQSTNHEQIKQNILLKFNQLFENNLFINKLKDYQNISIMRWRASQPTGYGIAEHLQVCEEYSVGFCGDWFSVKGFGRIEGAIISALNLANKIY